MSIILKGIDLPTNGETLIVGIYGNGLVSVEHSKPLVLPIEINADAIQIPKGHGRLIDADALELEKEVEIADDWKTAHEIANCVKYAPTILEAEENEC